MATQYDQNHLFPENQNPNSGKQSGYVPMTQINEVDPLDPYQNPNGYNPSGYQNTWQPRPNPAPGPNSYAEPQNPYYQETPNTNPYASPNPTDYQTLDNAYFAVEQIQEEKKQEEKKANSLQGYLNVALAFITAQWVIILIALVVLASVGFGIFYFTSRPQTTKTNPTQYTNVVTTIDAPKDLPQGSPGLWTITIDNREAISLTQLQLNLEFDTDFQFLREINPKPETPEGKVYKFARLDALGQGSSQVKISFEGILTGKIDVETVMKGTLSYIPEPLISKGERRQTEVVPYKTKITSPQIKLSVTPTNNQVQNGGEAEFTVIVENTTERDMRDLRLRMLYPSGNAFNYTSSEFVADKNSDVRSTPDSGDDVWYISRLAGLTRQTLKVRGTVNAANGIKLTFGAEISIRTQDNSYQELSKTFKDITITSQPLFINTKINGRDSEKIFRKGETLTFVVDYQNQSQFILKDVEITAFVDDPSGLLDLNTITFIGGVRGNINNTRIQWRGNSAPELVNLTPQVKGQFSYSIKVKNDGFIQTSRNENEYILRPRVQAKAANLQLIEYGGELYKAKSNLSFTQTVQKIDIPNLQANRKRYRIIWSLKTEQNNVNDVVVETISSLPPTAWQPNSITPASKGNQINYEPATGKIIWTAGNIENYLGISKPENTITFEIEIEEKGSTRITLFEAPKITGVDDFTGEKFQFSDRAVANR